MAHFHIPLVDPKAKLPTRNKLKGTSRNAVKLSELKAKGYEKPATHLNIKATRELGDSLKITNAVVAQDFDLKAHTSQIANLEKLIAITVPPDFFESHLTCGV